MTRRPRERLLGEELVEEGGLGEDRGVLRLAHHGLIAALLVFEALDAVLDGLEFRIGEGGLALLGLSRNHSGIATRSRIAINQRNRA